MSQRWKVAAGGMVTGWLGQGDTPAWTPIGSGPDVLPTRFECDLELEVDPPLPMTLRLRFDGRRVTIWRIEIGLEEELRAITPRDVVHLRLADAVRASCIWIVTKYSRRSPRPRGFEPRRRPGRSMTAKELELVAAVYAFEYAVWGEPRQAVMRVWGLGERTASNWIKRAAADFGGLPGVGGDRG